MKRFLDALSMAKILAGGAFFGLVALFAYVILPICLVFLILKLIL